MIGKESMIKRIKLVLAAAIAATVAAVAACAPPSTTPPGSDGGEGSKNLKVAVFNGWDEGIAASELWKAILTEKGYNVELEYVDVAPGFAGLSTGDYDVVFDGWLPVTHKDYVDKFGDSIDDLGAWNEDAKLTVAVNEDAPVDSLADLAANADEFGNKIVGIESGAGLTKQMNKSAIPAYKLDKMEFVTSSTPAMLGELKAATDKGENVVVTLWRPHWAYDAFPIKDLKDPEGAMGATENIHTFAKKDFETEFPELAGWLKGFKMDSKTLFSLENVMFNQKEKPDDYGPIVTKWIGENQEWVDGLTAA